MKTTKAINELLKKSKKLSTQKEFNLLKKQIAKKYNLSSLPKNTEIISSSKNPHTLKILKSKPVRTISGVAPLALMTSPIACPPQAKCTYCPGGPNSAYGNVPKSYTEGAPAVNRAIRNNYDPYLQIFNRLEHYILLNQNPTKVEIIIMGGTFPSFPKAYKQEFITQTYKALNDFSENFFTKTKFNKTKFNKFFQLPGNKDDKTREKKVQQTILKLKNSKESTLEQEKIKNKTSNIRCIALVIETRPDCSLKKEINEMLNFGTTRVELGIQNTDNKILQKIKRGHTVEDTIKATQLLKDSFLKVSYHTMLGLPGSTPSSDTKMFKELFTNPNFKPDSLKIYPCLIMKGTPLYEDWKKSKFKPITTQQALNTIIKIKKQIPSYCRIMRIQRDIPTYQTKAGVDRTNLRQMIHQKMEKAQSICNCIRCREPKNKQISYKDVKTITKTYTASKGTEVFISKQDTKNNILLGYCRLRIPCKSFRPEITPNSAGIRELHVFGTSINLKNKPKKSSEAQHRGLGKQLMKEAEKIAKEKYNSKKMLVISGIGVQEYYKNKLNYKQDGIYMSKKL